MNTKVSSPRSWNAAAGTPDAGCRSCFEPRHDTGTGRRPHRSEANPKAAGHSRDPSAGTLDATKPPQRVTRTQPSGQYAFEWEVAHLVAREHRWHERWRNSG